VELEGSVAIYKERIVIAQSAGVFLICALAIAAQTPASPDITGTWVEESSGAAKWVLAEKDGSIHVVQMNGDKVQADFTCPLNGKECDIKQGGRSEKVMIYYNGDKLVEIIEGHDGTTKKRLSVSADGKTLDVELVPLSSADKAEKTVFHRQTS
jgi:hypothetical protein